MSFRSTTAAGDYLHRLSRPVPAVKVPLTMACWFRRDNTTGTQHAFHLGTNTDSLRLQVNNNQGQCTHRTSATNSTATASGTFSAGTWNHLVGRFVSNSDRRAILNSGTEGSNTAARADINFNRVHIGRPQDASVQQFVGEIAHCAVWDEVLGDGEVERLFRGANPLSIRPRRLLLYWPLTFDGRNALNPTLEVFPAGAVVPVWRDDPPVEPPPRRYIYLVQPQQAGDALTLGAFANTNAFQGLTVSPGAVTLTVSAFSDGDAFGALTVTSGVVLTVDAFSDGDAFGTLTVSPGAVTLTVSAFADGDGFPALTVSSGETLSVGAFTNTNAFPAMTVTPGAVALSVAAFADGDAFGAMTVTPGAVSLSVAAFSDGDAFQALAVAPGPVTLAVGAFADGDAFGLLSVAGPIVVNGFSGANAFPAMTVAGGDQPTPEVELPRGFVLTMPGLWRFGVRSGGARGWRFGV